MAVFNDCWTQIHTDIKDNITTPGIVDANILKRRIPFDKNVTMPNIQISPRSETIEYYTNASDLLGYAFAVAIVKLGNDDLSQETDWFTIRQNIHDYFHNKRLLTVTSVSKCVVQALDTFNIAANISGNVDMQGLLIRCMSRNTTRG